MLVVPPVCSPTLSTEQKLFGDQHPDTFSAMTGLGELYMRQGRYEKAQPLLDEAVRGRRRVLGAKHPETLEALSMLGTVFLQQQNYGDAARLLKDTTRDPATATWQRFGRAGRRNGRSICVLVTSSAPLDQYLAREPEYLLGAPVEEARIDADNPEILIQHLKCAAFELPFKRGDRFGTLDQPSTENALQFLEQHQVVHENAGTFHWAADAYPANNV